MSNPLNRKRNSAAKKRFHDWLDRTRPWAQIGFEENVYPQMEDIAEHAAMFFTDEIAKSVLESRHQAANDLILKLTEKMDSHPEGYDGPCACAECKTA